LKEGIYIPKDMKIFSSMITTIEILGMKSSPVWAHCFNPVS